VAGERYGFKRYEWSHETSFEILSEQHSERYTDVSFGAVRVPSDGTDRADRKLPKDRLCALAPSALPAPQVQEHPAPLSHSHFLPPFSSGRSIPFDTTKQQKQQQKQQQQQEHTMAYVLTTHRSERAGKRSVCCCAGRDREGHFRPISSSWGCGRAGSGRVGCVKSGLLLRFWSDRGSSSRTWILLCYDGRGSPVSLSLLFRERRPFVLRDVLAGSLTHASAPSSFFPFLPLPTSLSPTATGKTKR
jgi:hypothetical protein